MGCFPKCFTACKRRKQKKSVTVTPFKVQSLEATEEVDQTQPTEPTKIEDFLKAIKPIKESKEENEEESTNGATKKVAFNLNVKVYDDEEEEESSTKEVVTKGSVEICDEKEKDTPKEIEPVSDSIVSSVVVSSHPSNHRYENCENREDEDEDEDEDVVDLEASDLNEEDNDVDDESDSKQQISIQEESSESLFSLSIGSRRQVCDAETDEKEVNSPMPKDRSDHNARDRRSQYGQSVLSRIENLAPWKQVKEKATPTTASKHQEKENIKMEQDLNIPFSPEPTSKLSKLCTRAKSNDQGTTGVVDTSLSSWLVESETTPESNASVGNNNSLCEGVINSPRSHDDRPILGAWTTEEIKQLSVSSTPKRSRSPSPDEIPTIGTVGSYWSHTGQSMDSDSSSSCREKAKWKSTTFEAKLERALGMGILEA